MSRSKRRLAWDEHEWVAQRKRLQWKWLVFLGRVLVLLVHWHRTAGRRKLLLELTIFVGVATTLFLEAGEKGLVLAIFLFVFRDLLLACTIELLVSIIVRSVYKDEDK